MAVGVRKALAEKLDQPVGSDPEGDNETDTVTDTVGEPDCDTHGVAVDPKLPLFHQNGTILAVDR